MGVDRSDTMTETKELGLAGQSDGIFLIAQDTARHTLKILMIPRDTMTEIPITNKERTLHDTKITQLTMAYAYGDGRKAAVKIWLNLYRSFFADLLLISIWQLIPQ